MPIRWPRLCRVCKGETQKQNSIREEPAVINPLRAGALLCGMSGNAEGVAQTGAP